MISVDFGLDSTFEAPKWKTCGTRDTSSSPNPSWVAATRPRLPGYQGTYPGPRGQRGELVVDEMVFDVPSSVLIHHPKLRLSEMVNI